MMRKEAPTTEEAAQAPPDALDAALRRLVPLARGWPGGAPLIVGGAVRDALLGRPIAEVDIAVPGDAPTFARAAAEALGSHAVAIDRERLGVYRLPLSAGGVDIVQMQGGPEADLARRDLSINALALPLEALPAAGLAAMRREAVIDRQDGLADLATRRVRFTGAHVIAADPLRMLRAVRIATELRFQLDPDSAGAITAAAPALAVSAAERVGAEIQRIFAGPQAHRGVGLLDETALLDVVFPELALGRGVDQRPNHISDVFRHQMAALDWLDVLLAPAAPGAEPAAELWRGLWSPSAWADALALRVALNRGATALRLATLLHDIAKPATRSVEAGGRTRFFGHAELGATMAAGALQRWRLPNALVDRAGLLVRHHLRPGQVASPGQAPTARALYRFHRQIGEAVPALCWLFLADALATAGPQALLPRWPAYVAHVAAIVDWRPPAAAAGPRPLIDGRAVMRVTGLAPGPAVGHILDALAEAAATGAIGDERSALALAVRLAREASAVPGAAPTVAPEPGASRDQGERYG